MVEGVVAHDMALGGHAPDNIRGVLYHVAHHEEGGGGVVLLQRVQNLLRVSVLISAVKGQIDYFFGRIPQIIRVVLAELLPAGVAHRGLALVLEAEAPVPGRGRDGGRGGGGDGLLLPEQGQGNGGNQRQRGQRAQGQQGAAAGL